MYSETRQKIYNMTFDFQKNLKNVKTVCLEWQENGNDLIYKSNYVFGIKKIRKKLISQIQ